MPSAEIVQPVAMGIVVIGIEVCDEVGAVGGVGGAGGADDPGEVGELGDPDDA